MPDALGRKPYHWTNTLKAAMVNARVVSLQRAGKSQRPAWRPSQGPKGLDERALMASQWPSHPW